MKHIAVQLDLAISFCKIAAESDNEQKITKFRADARRAYDMALHFLVSNPLEQGEQIAITKKLVSLKSDLRELGEKF